MRETIASGMMITLLFAGMLTFAFSVQPVRAESTTWYVDDDGGADFQTIQEAIDSSLVAEGDTIYVYNGTYYENVVVHKNDLALIGQSKYGVVIDGSGLGVVLLIAANNVSVARFTVQGSGYGSWDGGICVDHSSYSSISQNIVVGNQAGILLSYSSDNRILNNTAVANVYGGIAVLSSTNNVVANNTASGNVYGISLSRALYGSSDGNTIAGNTASYNEYGISLWYDSDSNGVIGNNVSNNEYGIYYFESSFNVVFHNNFIENTVQAYCLESVNIWDDGYPSCGNYWSNYEDQDLFIGPGQDRQGIDGVWDHPYFIDDYNEDKYPLVSLWTPSWIPPSLPPEASADLVRRAAWPEHRHYDISRDEDGCQTLSAKVKNLSPSGLNLSVSVKFEIVREDGLVVTVVTEVKTVTSGEVTTLAAILGPLGSSDTGKYYATAKCYYSHTGTCWGIGEKSKTLSFHVLP
jgi:parallel beta-helix repeat protein